MFVRNGAGEWGGVDFNFNGWGGKQAHADDAEVAGYVSGAAKARPLATELVLEGGGIEVDAQALADVVAAGRLGTRSKAGLPVPITGNMPEL